MKNFLLLLILLSQFSACSVYKPLEKVVPNLPESITEEESVRFRIQRIKQGEKIKVILRNGKEFFLTFNRVEQEFLIGNYDLPKNKQPVQVPIDQIEKLSISKINVPLTASISILGAIGIYSFLVVSTQNLLSGWDFSF